MENKANYALIGAFATIVLAGFLAFVYWFSVADKQEARVPYDVVFQGSVTGLNAGTDVLFNGLKVGNVSSVTIAPNNPGQVIAKISIIQSAPVMKDTRVILEVQGITGQAHIQLLGGTVAAGRVEVGAILNGEPSALDELLNGAGSILKSAESAINRIDGLLEDNQDRVTETLKNVEAISQSLAALSGGSSSVGDDLGDVPAVISGLREFTDSANATMRILQKMFDDNAVNITASIANIEKFSGAFAQNSDGVDTFLKGMTNAADQIVPLADELRMLTEQVRTIVAEVPVGSIERTMSDVAKFADTLATNSQNVDTFFKSAGDIAGNMRGLSEGLNGTLSLIDEASAAIDPLVIRRAMASIDKFSGMLGDNTPTVEEILANARTMTETLSTASTRIDTILASVDDMVASEEGGSMFGEIGDAARAIRILAQQLDTRTAEITTGISRFTNQGLGDFSGLANDARSAIQRLDRVLSNVERNPQMFVFGGQTVRDFERR